MSSSPGGGNSGGGNNNNNTKRSSVTFNTVVNRRTSSSAPVPAATATNGDDDGGGGGGGGANYGTIVTTTTTTTHDDTIPLNGSEDEDDENEETNLIRPTTERVSNTSSLTAEGFGSDEDDNNDDDDDDKNSTETYDVEELESLMSELSRANSFHLGNTRISAANVWTSFRRTTSFQEYGEEYELVPTELVDNIKLVTDPNLHDRERGRLYFAESSFYQNTNPPKYALTIQSFIYQKVLKEVNEAYSVPCGLYFCCHGGDGAHTGVSHDDYVDIRLAWVLVTMMFMGIIMISISIPYPDNYADITDDFFQPTTTFTTGP